MAFNLSMSGCVTVKKSCYYYLSLLEYGIKDTQFGSGRESVPVKIYHQCLKPALQGGYYYSKIKGINSSLTI